MEKAIAVIVTFNRCALLAECITALRNQTRKLDAILVVNNGSTDNTAKWLTNQTDIFYINQPNSGSGGGFHTGISWAYKNGYSWIWCMDDDGYPKEDAFEQLLLNEPNHRSLLNCAVINKDDRQSFVWKTKNYKTIGEVHAPLIKGIGHPFNGTLLHRAIVEKVGVPKASLFLWGDETEYYYRIVKRHNIPVYTVSSSIHYHPAAAYSFKKDWDFNHSWKMYYYVRNRFYIQRSKYQFKLFSFFTYLVFLAALTLLVMYYQKTDRFKKISFMAIPVRDAITNNFTATPPVILAKLKKHADREHSGLQLQLKNFWQSVIRPASVNQQARVTES